MEAVRGQFSGWLDAAVAILFRAVGSSQRVSIPLVASFGSAPSDAPYWSPTEARDEFATNAAPAAGPRGSALPATGASGEARRYFPKR